MSSSFLIMFNFIKHFVYPIFIAISQYENINNSM